MGKQVYYAQPYYYQRATFSVGVLCVTNNVFSQPVASSQIYLFIFGIPWQITSFCEATGWSFGNRRANYTELVRLRVLKFFRMVLNKFFVSISPHRVLTRLQLICIQPAIRFNPPKPTHLPHLISFPFPANPKLRSWPTNQRLNTCKHFEFPLIFPLQRTTHNRETYSPSMSAPPSLVGSNGPLSLSLFEFILI